MRIIFLFVTVRVLMKKLATKAQSHKEKRRNLCET